MFYVCLYVSDMPLRLYLAVVAALITVIVLGQIVSQLSGQNVYTGDELDSRYSERIHEAREKEERRLSDLKLCLEDATTQSDEDACFDTYP